MPSISRTVALGIFMLCTGYVGTVAQAARVPDLRGLWLGQLVQDKGICPQGGHSTLSVSYNEVTFTPADSSIVLHGTPHKDGTVHAELIGSDRNHKPLPMVFDGQLEGNTIQGLYGTPSCRAHITMERPN